MGPVHALSLTWREEGMRGLYRGYSAYLIATSIYLLIIPISTELITSSGWISGTIKDDTDALIGDLKKNSKK
jgi:hypothetical protein